MGSLNRVRLSTLVQIAAGGFIAGSTALYLAQKSMQKKVRALPHYAESLKIIADHDKAREALGTPIELGTVDLADRHHNYVGKTNSMLMVPVNGSMAAGYMEVRAVRDTPEGVFSTATIKLHLDETVVTIYDTGAWREETSPKPTTTPASK
ncbi:hypothetical protein PENTCL1PPCAC_18410 [Pristionchus entomophagus]|uniref:Cytochrome oxidase complex assembly protein 1 n=1 Tax=Pristionchus entomophagus TaxID=358040 RepID=A0AAV5TP84_9BILA|nr:hypothetical protein PENTCL1PPCAC_18410 [Pristionchus entomophagus]